MSKVFFPTVSLNRFGVRDTNQRATLGAVQRFDSEPNTRSANNPTGPMLGAIQSIVGDGAIYDPIIRVGYPIQWIPPASTPAPGPAPQPVSSGPISSSGGGGPVPTPSVTPPAAAAPVSSQVGPTPTVTVPPPSPTSVLLISSGGGTQSPSTPAVVAPAASGGFVDNIGAWLGGSTNIFNHNVPNALLAGVVVLGFAWLSSNSGKKR